MGWAQRANEKRRIEGDTTPKVGWWTKVTQRWRRVYVCAVCKKQEGTFIRHGKLLVHEWCAKRIAQ